MRITWLYPEGNYVTPADHENLNKLFPGHSEMAQRSCELDGSSSEQRKPRLAISIPLTFLVPVRSRILHAY
jgi:hypothetical protein